MEKNTRFKDAPWLQDKTVDVVLGGAGGISSWTALFLARALGKNLYLSVFDYDRIEIQNLGGQFFKDNQTGLLKVTALQENISEYANVNFQPFSDKYDETVTAPFMIAGFDNMKARKQMFDAWVSDPESKDTDLFIDGRLLAEQLQIFCVKRNSESISDYKKYLFSDNEVEEAPCTFKQTTHVAAIIGGMITGFLLNHLVNIYENGNSRAVPFSYEHLLPVNLVL